jgi:hypothetical protein
MTAVEFVTNTEEFLEYMTAGIIAERQRILDILDRESNDMVAKGDTESDALYLLSRLIDEIGVAE